MDLQKLVSEMDDMNMVMMVNLSGGSDERLYKALENVKENYPKRFILFANVNFKNIDQAGWTETATKQLEKDVHMGAKGLKVFKSLGMFDTDSKGNRSYD